MPYGNFFGIRYHYRETKTGKGFWIFWYILEKKKEILGRL